MKDQCANTLQALFILTEAAAKAGQLEAAERICRRAVETAQLAYGQDDPVTALSLRVLNELLAASDKEEEEEVKSNQQRIRCILSAYLKQEGFSASYIAEAKQYRI